MRGHERGRKTEWFARSHTGSFARFLTAAKVWLLTTLPIVQLSRSAPSVDDVRREHERAQLENLEADTRLKKLQAQALEDEREQLPLKRREHVLNIEIAEIKRGLTLLGVVLLGAAAVAAIALDIAGPGLSQPGPNFSELLRLLGK